mgnify:CR=1 FL=1
MILIQSEMHVERLDPTELSLGNGQACEQEKTMARKSIPDQIESNAWMWLITVAPDQRDKSFGSQGAAQ